MSKPLEGMRVLELGGIGPVPFAGMMLRDHGADVTKVVRPEGTAASLFDTGKSVLVRDLKDEHQRAEVVELIRGDFDVVLEGFRPGVAERLGLGPDVFRDAGRRIIYGRMTAWGRTVANALAPAHDINCIAASGFLGAVGHAGGPPVVPLNLTTDFGGGGLMLAFGVLAALANRNADGVAVVDASMHDGVLIQLTEIFGAVQQGEWIDRRGSNLLDGGSPFYNVYECRDGEYVAIGANEPKFYRNLVNALGLEEELLDQQWDQSLWPKNRERFAVGFRKRTRDEWVELARTTDLCLDPVLSLTDALTTLDQSADGYRRPSVTPQITEVYE